MIDIHDMTHPDDDFAKMRRHALDILRDTAIDLGLPFTVEDDTFIVRLPPDLSIEARLEDPHSD